MLEFLAEVVGEFILQLFVEVLIEAGFQSLAAPFRKEPSPALAVFGHCLFGLIVGGVSLLIFPQHLVASPALRWINLIVTPVLVGLSLTAVGAWRKQRGQIQLRLDTFTYAYLFALSLAAVRFIGAN
jgi:uncharacterized YccA/Bax inhibitor family protein